METEKRKNISAYTMGVYDLLNSLSKEIKAMSAEIAENIPDTCHVIKNVENKTTRRRIKDVLARGTIDGRWNIQVNVSRDGVSVKPDNGATLSINCQYVKSTCPEECPLRRL
jgi:hypothetical protein